MRHAFAFPPEVRDAVRRHVREAYVSVSPLRFQQESPWVTAVASRLEGIAYDGPEGRVEFISTIFNDRGTGSAESRYGADLAITATISKGRDYVRKAILFQAKLGNFEDLPRRDQALLEAQIRKMQQVTRSPKLLEIEEDNGIRKPQILSANRYAAKKPAQRLPFEQYFTRRVLTTLDGDTRPSFVRTVETSEMTQIHVIATA